MNPFENLEQHYPEVIQMMRSRFNAHQFILVLAHRYQRLYVAALAEYIDNEAPFMVVHGRLAKALNNFSELIYYDGDESSTDIFGHSGKASVWIKR